MKFKKIMFVGIFLLAILAIGAVSASDVNSTPEEISIDGQTEYLAATQQNVLETDDGTFTALQDKINNAAEGSTITLENDFINIDKNNKGITISKCITIDGNNHIIDAKAENEFYAGIFKIKANNVILKNIFFKNAMLRPDLSTGYNGPAINIDRELDNIQITNCTFLNNIALNSDGGAIYIEYGTTNILVDDCIFSNNKAGGCGGAICLSGECSGKITNCKFNNNSADIHGGAIYVYGNIEVNNCEFNSNIAGKYGAGIYNNGNLKVINSNFIKNSPAGKTGAIYNYDGSQCQITNSKFDSDSSNSVKTTKSTPKLTAKAKIFKKSTKTKKYAVSLKTNKNKAIKNTKVTLKVNKKTYTAKTDKKGVATFKITKLTKKGKYSATIKYAGSKNYNSKTVKVKITVK